MFFLRPYLCYLHDERKLPSALEIMAGGLNWDVTTGSEQIISVYNIYVFEGYNSTFKMNDIALLKVYKDSLFKITSKIGSEGGRV